MVALGSSGAPEIVVCSSCGARHRFRERKPEVPRARARATGRTLTTAQPYSPAGSYRIGDTIDHPKFGVGEVKAAREGKIEVMFGQDTRLLLHAGQR